MKKLLFYSHDTYGLGNIRRTLSICKALVEFEPKLSILIVSGSPVVHSFRIPAGIDYIKLPCLSRSARDGYTPKFLAEDSSMIMKMRTDMIQCATKNFRPDLIVVDKKPFGVDRELEPALDYAKQYLPDVKLVLLLRDILDNPDSTKKIWEKEKYHQAINDYYDSLCILGLPEVFDQGQEYAFPISTQEKVQYCGYIQREPGDKDRDRVRNELGLREHEKLVLVTAGGGEDGLRLFENYLAGLKFVPQNTFLRHLMILGPEMSESHKKELYLRKMYVGSEGQYPKCLTFEFTDDLMSYMNASDLVVSMGGYGTVCEILTTNKPAIIVPRVDPVEEQWIRAKRMAGMGLFRTIHPNMLTPQTLITAVLDELHTPIRIKQSHFQLDLGALPKISRFLSTLMAKQANSSNKALSFAL